jgi:hypothetical protein
MTPNIPQEIKSKRELLEILEKIPIKNTNQENLRAITTKIVTCNHKWLSDGIIEKRGIFGNTKKVKLIHCKYCGEVEKIKI